MKKRLKNKKASVDSGAFVTKAFLKLAKRAYLGGLIEACVLKLSAAGIASVRAIDPTNSLFISVSEKVCGVVAKPFTVGIGNLDVFVNLLSSIKEETFSLIKKENLLSIIREGRVSFKYLLSDIDVIPTSMEDAKGDPVKKIIEGSDHQFVLKQEIVGDFSSYSSLTKSRNAQVVVKDGNVELSAGEKTGHRFRIPVTKIKTSKSFSSVYFGDYLNRIFAVLEFSEDCDKPKFLFGSQKPAVITQGENNIWALVPAMEDASDEA